MISYELALKLKEAGFPQADIGRESPSSWYDCDGELLDWGSEENDVYIPTLSELIGECGERFKELRLYHKPLKPSAVAQARGAKREDGSTSKDIKTEGSSPEEAVANLYLALAKK